MFYCVCATLHQNESEEQKELKGKVGKKRRDSLKRSEIIVEKRDRTEDASESAAVDGLDQTDPQELKDIAVQEERENDGEILVPKNLAAQGKD